MVQGLSRGPFAWIEPISTTASKLVRRLAQRALPLWMQSHIRPFLDGLTLATCSTRREKGDQQYGAIFLLHGLGDTLLAARTVEALAYCMRERNLRSRLFVSPENLDFSRRYLDVDEVLALNWRLFESNLTYRARVVRSIARVKYALAIQPTLNRRLAVEDSLMRATRAPERWGAVGSSQFIEPFERLLGDRFYTRLISQGNAAVHDLESYRVFMEALGIQIKASPWRLHLPAGPSQALKQPYMVVCPQASDIVRTWSLQSFLKVALAVASPRDWNVVLVGREKEAPVEWPPDCGVGLSDLRGVTSGDALPLILRNARFVLTNDSGPYHLAIALGRPSLGVGGSGMPYRYYPYPEEERATTTMMHRPVPCAGCHWRCIHTLPRITTAWCIQQLSWQEVAAAAHDILAG